MMPRLEMRLHAEEYAIGLLAGFMMLLIGACGGGSGGEGGDAFASIASLEMRPEQLSRNKATGMTDQYFQIRLQVEQFNADVDRIEIFVQDRENSTRTPIFRDEFALGSPSCVDNTCGGADNLESCVRQQCGGTGTSVVVSSDDVLFTIFRDFEPMVYDVGASVIDEDESGDPEASITQRNLTSIEITE